MLIVLGVPFVLSAGKKGTSHEDGLRTLIVVTPHVPQIRDEFAQGFRQWHLREFGEPVSIDFRTPGGTSEIRKQLEAMFKTAAREHYSAGEAGKDPQQPVLLPEGTIAFDVMFGGGSYDHTLVKNGVSVNIGGETLNVPMSRPADFTQAELDDLLGENRIGPQELYDPQQYWIGTALSSFGIVYNRDVFAKLGLDEPRAFVDLTDPALLGWIALADPRQSGSITTTFDSILGNEGWKDGWRTLRAMCGNTRYFTNSSTKPPIDVSQGEAAAGLAIDFYGRGQAQVIAESGGGDRVGYSDPEGAVYVDADPVSIINGGPDYELASRFVRYCLTDEAQALWQFEAGNPDNPVGSGGEPMGPSWHELRRMPVKRSMYTQYFDRFVDKVDPFEIVSDVENPGWRTGVQVMMGCFGIDIANDCRKAYASLNRARASGEFSEAEMGELDTMFYAFPETKIESLASLPGYEGLSEDAQKLVIERGLGWIDDIDFTGTTPAEIEIARLVQTEYFLPFTEETYGTVRNEWRQSNRQARLEIAYTKFFRNNYREIVRRVDERL